MVLDGKRGKMRVADERSGRNVAEELVMDDTEPYLDGDSVNPPQTDFSQKEQSEGMFEGLSEPMQRNHTQQDEGEVSLDEGFRKKYRQLKSPTEDSHNLFGRRALENLDELYSSLNTHQANEENERQLQKYEADIRQHISIE